MRRRAAICLLALGLWMPGGSAAAETLLERGTYLMESIAACGNCHTPGSLIGSPKEAMALAGGSKWEEKPFMAYAPNITPDKETGIGGWTDGQIIAAIREGRHPSGGVLGPPMPYDMYRQMSDRDARAIVAYLRSIRPIRHPVPRGMYRTPLKALPPAGAVADVPRSDKVRYGEYLAGPVGHCMECHTPFAKPGVRDYARRLGAGGFRLAGEWGVSFSANITPDPETGIGRWTDRQIKVAITNGTRPDGRKMHPPMPYHFYQRISREDLDAIVAYLRTLRPVRNEVRVRFVPPKK